jgi:hypothetical protein
VLLFRMLAVRSCCCIRLQSAPRLFGICRRSIRRAPCRDLAYDHSPKASCRGSRSTAMGRMSPHAPVSSASRRRFYH